MGTCIGARSWLSWLNESYFPSSDEDEEEWQLAEGEQAWIKAKARFVSGVGEVLVALRSSQNLADPLGARRPRIQRRLPALSPEDVCKLLELQANEVKRVDSTSTFQENLMQATLEQFEPEPEIYRPNSQADFWACLESASDFIENALVRRPGRPWYMYREMAAVLDQLGTSGRCNEILAALAGAGSRSRSRGGVVTRAHTTHKRARLASGS